MGHADRFSRRNVLDTAREARERVNETVERYNDLVQSVQAIGEDLEQEKIARADGDVALQRRLAAQGLLIEALETKALALAQELEAVNKFTHGVDRRCDGTEAAISRVGGSARAVHGDFLDLRDRGFRGRLTWLVFGR